MVKYNLLTFHIQCIWNPHWGWFLILLYLVIIEERERKLLKDVKLFWIKREREQMRGFFFYKPVNIIVDLIVAGECQKDPKAWPQRKENLRCGVYPHLHWNNRMSIT